MLRSGRTLRNDREGQVKPMLAIRIRQPTAAPPTSRTARRLSHLADTADTVVLLIFVAKAFNLVLRISNLAGRSA